MSHHVTPRTTATKKTFLTPVNENAPLSETVVVAADFRLEAGDDSATLSNVFAALAAEQDTNRNLRETVVDLGHDIDELQHSVREMRAQLATFEKDFVLVMGTESQTKPDQQAPAPIHWKGLWRGVWGTSSDLR